MFHKYYLHWTRNNEAIAKYLTFSILFLDLVAVSSTVIPLEDLPVYKVGIGFQVPNMPKFKKPNKPTELLTHKNAKTKKPIYEKKATIKEISKDQFQKYGKKQ